jgi:hypothetical protein
MLRESDVAFFTYWQRSLLEVLKKNLLCIWYQGSFPGAKRPVRSVDLPPLSSAEVKNEVSYGPTSTPSLCLHGMLRGDLYLNLTEEKTLSFSIGRYHPYP